MQVLIVDLLAGLATVCGYLAAIGLLVEIPVQQGFHRIGESSVQGDFPVFQHALELFWLFHHVAARVGLKQAGKMVFYIPEAPLNDFRFGVADYGVCHLDAQPLKYRGHLKAFLTVLGLFLSVAQAANVMGQELAAIVYIDIFGDPVFQDALAQRNKRGLAAGGRGDVAPGEDARPGVKESRKVQPVALAVLALRDNVKGMVIGHPPLVAGHFLIYAMYVGGAAVTESLLALAAQHFHGFGYIVLHPAPECGIGGDIRHQLRGRVLEVEPGVLIALLDGVLGLVQVVA